LLALELHGVALVEGLISILLDSGEMYEDVFPGGPLDKSVSFGPVEPLHHAIFLQAKSLSDFYLLCTPEDTTSDGKCRARASRNRERFENGETITPRGLPSGSNHELLFELDDVMAGIATQCKKNLPNGCKRRWDGTSRL
jgi:hypothetical protein